MQPIKIGLIGNGGQMRNYHLPYLEKRIDVRGDVEIKWGSGCLCLEEEKLKYPDGCPMKEYVKGKECNGHADDWQSLLVEEPVDAIVVSLPDHLHANPIREALKRGVNVVVDKPTTTDSKTCSELVNLSDRNGLVFVTISQRRYEDVYLTAYDIIRNGGLGEPRFVDYLISHERFDSGIKKWRGGSLLTSGYHGIDTILWLLGHCAKGAVKAKSVSARCFGNPGQETVASVRIVLTNGGIFNITASYENPKGGLHENITIAGTEGIIRIIRDRPRRVEGDQSAANLSYQHKRGSFAEYDTRGWQGKRWAPLEDFIDAVHAKMNNNNWSVWSPASESIQTIEVIEKAYESARQDGKEIELNPIYEVVAIHHTAVQTSDIDKALKFYTEVLGAKLLERRNFKKRDMAWLKVGDVKIELFSKREGEELEAWNDFYSGPVHIAFAVQDLDAFLEAAVGRGAQFHPSHPEPFVPPVPGAQKIAYLLGPDGEEVEIRDVSYHS
jgi:predicted dehydrogenase/catechol 2,3-dioxygenase-like lactoylglutathione lyase family enzyme